jgi:hypothetical protein
MSFMRHMKYIHILDLLAWRITPEIGDGLSPILRHDAAIDLAAKRAFEPTIFPQVISGNDLSGKYVKCGHCSWGQRALNRANMPGIRRGALPMIDRAYRSVIFACSNSATAPDSES